MTRLKSKNFKGISITTLALFLIFQPIPLGLGKFELISSSIIGFIILLINKEIIIKKKILLLFTFLILILGTIYSITFYEESFYVWQFFRSLTLTYIFLIFMFADIKISFFEKIDKYLPFLILCALINILMYFVGLDFYNSPLQLHQEVGRFYIFYLELIFFTSIIFLANLNIWLLSNFFILSVTFSKEVFLKIFIIILPFFFYFKKNFREKIYFLLICFIMIIYALSSSLKERIEIFYLLGDNYRASEFNSVLSRLTDPIRFLIGNGAGVKYKNILHEDTLASEISNNFFFDVHNLFLKLCLLFGFPLAFILLILFYKSLSLKNFFFRILIIIHIITLPAVSIFLAISIRYLNYKFSTITKISKKISATNKKIHI